MPMTLKGSCRCAAVRFRVASHTPVPYQRCYCSICRKTAGGGGYAINLGADNRTLEVDGQDAIGIYRAEIERPDGSCEKSNGERNFCRHCATALWLWSPDYPDLVHPFARVIDTELPEPAERTHLMLAFKPDWVDAAVAPGDKTFDHYPDESLEEWHRRTGAWVA